jgi:hypothetical protein
MSDKRGIWSNLFTRMRLSKYLNKLRASAKASVEKLADVIVMDEARLRDWMTAKPKRGPKDTTLFDLGNILRRKGGLPTSGMECLYGYGYWTELFELLKHISVDRVHDGPRIATHAYCVLPDIEFERVALEGALGELPEVQRDLMKAHHKRDLGLFQTDAAGKRYFDSEDWADERNRIIESLRDSATLAVIENAWHHVQQERVQPTGEAPVDEESLAIMEAVITLSRDPIMREAAPPTIIGVRLWRMLAEWAYANGPLNEDRFLPDVFATSKEVERRDFEHMVCGDALGSAAAADAMRDK